MAAFILPAVSALAGLFGGGKQQQTKGTQDTSQTDHGTSSSNTTSNQTGSTTGATAGHQLATNTHNLSPLQQQLADTFTKQALDLNSSATDLTGYKNSGLQNINDSSQAQNTILQNSLASRGLSFSPAAGNAESMNQQNRLNQQTSFLQGLPLLQRQMQEKSQANLVSAFSALPTDTTQEGFSEGSSNGTSNLSGTSDTTGVTDSTKTGHTDQTGTVSGNPLAGAVSGLGAGLASPQANGKGSNLGGIINMISGLFGG